MMSFASGSSLRLAMASNSWVLIGVLRSSLAGFCAASGEARANARNLRKASRRFIASIERRLSALGGLLHQIHHFRMARLEVRVNSVVTTEARRQAVNATDRDPDRKLHENRFQPTRSTATSSSSGAVPQAKPCVDQNLVFRTCAGS